MATQDAMLVIKGKRVGTVDSPKDIMTTTEKVVGQWINGKPLYEITVVFPDATQSATRTINLSSLHIKEVAFMNWTTMWSHSSDTSGYYFAGDVTVTSATGTSGTTHLNYTRVYYQCSTGLLYFEDYSTTNDAGANVTIRYTKTTD